MNFEPSDEQIAIIDMARAFAEEELAPYAIEWDEKKYFPVETLRKADSLEMDAMCTRGDAGGTCLSGLHAAMIVAALARGRYPDRGR